MQLHPFQTQLADGVQLLHRPCSFQRIDAAEADESPRMVTTRLGDQLVGHPRSAGGGLRVPRQQDRHHVDGFVVARQLLERAARDGRPEVSLCGLDVTPHRHVQPLRGGQVDVEIDGSHGRRMIVTMDATLLVLAGGASRRMGRPKAWLEVGNTILLRWVADRLGSKFNEVIVAFAEPEQIEQPIQLSP